MSIRRVIMRTTLKSWLQIEKIRLLIWGSLVGLDGLASKCVGPLTLYIEAGVSLQIFANSKELVSRYGLQAREDADATCPLQLLSTPGSVSSPRIKAMLSVFSISDEANQSGIDIRERARWAIHDRSKFVLLVQDLKDLIDGLNAITPNMVARHKRMVKREIESVRDPETLALVQSATEHDYPGMITAILLAMYRIYEDALTIPQTGQMLLRSYWISAMARCSLWTTLPSGLVRSMTYLQKFVKDHL